MVKHGHKSKLPFQTIAVDKQIIRDLKKIADRKGFSLVKLSEIAFRAFLLAPDELIAVGLGHRAYPPWKSDPGATSPESEEGGRFPFPRD